MATLKQKILAEQTMRELLEQNDMPEPDEVEYGYGCIRLFFNEPKVVVVIDIDEPPEGSEPALGVNLSDDELFPDDPADLDLDDAA